MTTIANQETPGAAEEPYERTSGPVHTWFSLSYCNFLVWHRAHMQSMPLDWQRRFVELAEELDAAYPDGTGVDYEVNTVRFSYVSELSDDEMRLLGVTTSDDEEDDDDWDGVSAREWPEREFYLKDGRAVPGIHRAGIPVPDSVPHYKHSYLAPDEDGIAALRTTRAAMGAPKG